MGRVEEEVPCTHFVREWCSRVLYIIPTFNDNKRNPFYISWRSLSGFVETNLRLTLVSLSLHSVQ